MTRIITTSLLKAFLLCPLEAYYMEQGLQKPQKPGSPLARGSFIHELLDTGTPPDLGPDMFDEERALYDDYIHLVEAYHFNWRNADWRRIKSEFKLHRPIRDGVEYWARLMSLSTLMARSGLSTTRRMCRCRRPRFAFSIYSTPPTSGFSSHGCRSMACWTVPASMSSAASSGTIS